MGVKSSGPGKPSSLALGLKARSSPVIAILSSTAYAASLCTILSVERAFPKLYNVCMEETCLTWDLKLHHRKENVVMHSCMLQAKRNVARWWAEGAEPAGRVPLPDCILHRFSGARAPPQMQRFGATRGVWQCAFPGRVSLSKRCASTRQAQLCGRMLILHSKRNFP